MPKVVNEKLDKLNRDFLWGSTDRRRRLHLVNWRTVCLPKDRGGLGFIPMDDMNRAIFMKLIWELLQKRNTLWVQMLLAKYTSKDDILSAKKPTFCSPFWRQLYGCIASFSRGLKWLVRNGLTARFWSDWWVGNGPLLPDSLQQIPHDSLDLPVAAFLDENNQWDWTKFQHLLPLRRIAEIASVLVNKSEPLPDSTYWGFTSDGKFSVKSACEFLTIIDQPRSTIWNLAWRLHTRQRIRTFMWLALHNKLPCNETRLRRHLTNDASCPRCADNMESLLHLLRDCPSSRLVWLGLVPPGDHHQFFYTSLKDWLCFNLAQRSRPNDIDPPWATVFGVACWKLWSWRCKKVFENCDLQSTRAINWIRQSARDDTNAWMKLANIQNPSRTRISHFLGWSCPQHGTIKINVDGSAHGNPENIACGGIARDYEGKWLFGFTANLGYGSITTAELWGIYYGLSEALRRGFIHVLVNCDSKIVVQLLKSSTPDTHPHRNLIDSCGQLSSRLLSCAIHHDFRETNIVADKLANLGHSHTFGLHPLDYPPSMIAPYLLFDTVGGITLRSISE